MSCPARWSTSRSAAGRRWATPGSRTTSASTSLRRGPGHRRRRLQQDAGSGLRRHRRLRVHPQQPRDPEQRQGRRLRGRGRPRHRPRRPGRGALRAGLRRRERQDLHGRGRDPRNFVDENCDDKAPAAQLSPFPAVSYSHVAVLAGRQFGTLKVTSVGKGYRIAVRCRGSSRCPGKFTKKTKSRRAVSTNRYKRLFAPGAEVEVRVTRPGVEPLRLLRRVQGGRAA